MAEDEAARAGGEDIRAALAAQLLQLRPRDLLTQTAVMLANQAAIRLGMASPEHADREQAREAIDALAGIVELIAPTAEPEELEALRRDLAQLRMAFVQSGEPRAAAGAQEPPPEDEGPASSGLRSGRRAARSDAETRLRSRPSRSLRLLDAAAPEPVADAGLRRSHKDGRIRRM